MNNAVYLIGTERTHSAIDAWSSGRSSQQNPLLDLGAGFYAHDWTVQPFPSIETLENVRVAQIKAKGQPIRVLYSGGSDSHSIAHAFARNGVAVRYTVITWFTLANNVLDSDFWNRIKLNQLQDLHKRYGLPEPEVEFIRVDKEMHDRYFASSQFTEASYYGCNLTFSLNYFPGALKFSKWDATKTINVYGIEKPRVYQDDTGLYWQITDTMSMYAHSTEQDCTWFYLSDECLPLVAKQVWSVVEHAKTMPQPLGEALHLLQTHRDFYYQWCQVLCRKTNLWFALMSKQSKVTRVMHTAEDDKRYQHLPHYLELNNQAWRNYRGLLSKLNDLKIGSTITPVLSPRYYLSKKKG